MYPLYNMVTNSQSVGAHDESKQISVALALCLFHYSHVFTTAIAIMIRLHAKKSVGKATPIICHHDFLISRKTKVDLVCMIELTA